ncbi:MAG: hypothetical protein AAGH57_02580 [Pseudomonadota bacterium]
MPTYFLPELNADFQAPEDHGDWMRPGRLDAMAGALRISNDQVEIDALKSLPDPWARPLIFSQALTAQIHVAKDSARRKWRGLLALLGLQRFYEKTYSIDLLITDLNDTDQGNRAFRDVLRVLAPTDVLVETLDWDRTGVITIQALGKDRFTTSDHHAIGLMVPNCLVAPSRGAAKITIPDVKWLRNGLRDPYEVANDPKEPDGDLPVEQWAALYDYLGRLFSLLNSPLVSTRGEKLRDELAMFAQDCMTMIERAGGSTHDHDYEGSVRGLPADFYAPVMDAPKRPVIEYDQPSECELQLRSDNGLTGPGGSIKGVLLNDEEIARHTLPKEVQNIRFWNDHMLGSLSQRGTMDAVERDVLREGYLIITPEDLLTSKLTRLAGGAKVPQHTLEWDSFLLPISPLVLFIYDRNDLAEKLTISDRGDRIEVRLDVPIINASKGGRAHTHTIIREYAASDVIDEGLSEDLILWPNVGRANWPWTFLRMSHNPGYQLAPRFAASSTSLAAIVHKRANANPENAIDLLQAIASNEDTLFERQEPFFNGIIGELRATDNSLIAQRHRFKNLTDIVSEQHLLPMGADALFFSADPNETGDAIPAGCLMLPERRSDERSGKVEIAVDFGTTNTVVYIKSSGDAERIEFKSRLMRPIALRTSSDDQFKKFAVELMPSADTQVPFPTVQYEREFQVRASDGENNARSSPYPGIDNNIFFLPDVEDPFGAAIEYDKSGKLKFNLKWTDDPEMRRYVHGFLRQIIMMSSVEVMAKGYTLRDVKWHFSYPQAWNRPRATNFHNLIKQVWREIYEPIVGREVTAEQALTFETEGGAALRYFTEGPGMANKAGNLIIMYDIGGGTTEIAIYWNDRVVWRSSFQLAGGDFFTSFMTENISIFSHIQDRQSGASSFNEALKANEIAKPDRNFVELYISQHSFDDSFERSYTMFSDADEGRALRDCALTALGGMFYYTGLALKNCLSEGIFSENALKDVTLAFAGRGATFFRHLGDASDPESELGSVARIITDVALAKDDDEADTEQEEKDDRWDDSDEDIVITALFSSAPKHEVAFGMLCGQQQSRSRARIETTPLGETISVREGREIRELSACDAVEDISPNTEIESLGWSEFDKFIKVFGERTGIAIDIDGGGQDGRRDITNASKRQFASSIELLDKREGRNPLGETLEIEPLFITRLRVLVSILAENMAEKEQKVTVHHRESSW